MAEGLTNLLAELGFAYTTRVGEIIPLLPGVNRVKSSQSLCYSTRAGWRRFASGVWNKHLYGRLRDTDLVRLSLHPRDLEFRLMRRQIDQILRASLKRGFQPPLTANMLRVDLQLHSRFSDRPSEWILRRSACRKVTASRRCSTASSTRRA